MNASQHIPQTVNNNKSILLLVFMAAIGAGLMMDAVLWWYHAEYNTVDIDMEINSHRRQAKAWIMLNDRVTQLETKVQQCKMSSKEN